MLKHTKRLLLDNAIFIALFITLAIGFLSLIKLGPNGIPIQASDKVLHAIAYFSLMLSWLYSTLRFSKLSKKAKYLIAGCLIYGIVLEILQAELTSYRTGSYLDIIANSVGIVLAVLTFQLLEKKNRVI